MDDRSSSTVVATTQVENAASPSISANLPFSDEGIFDLFRLHVRTKQMKNCSGISPFGRDSPGLNHGRTRNEEILTKPSK